MVLKGILAHRVYLQFLLSTGWSKRVELIYNVVTTILSAIVPATFVTFLPDPGYILQRVFMLTWDACSAMFELATATGRWMKESSLQALSLTKIWSKRIALVMPRFSAWGDGVGLSYEEFRHRCMHSEIAEGRATMETLRRQVMAQATQLSESQAQRQTLQSVVSELEAKLERLAADVRATREGSQALKASYEQFRASLALAGHWIIHVDRSAFGLGESIGEGDLTMVHKAMWQEMPSAYQQLKVSDMSDADVLAFQREVLALTGMKHSRLSMPYAYTVRPCGLLMPLRVSLRARIIASPPSWEVRYRIAYDMAQGLAYLHEQGQVHGHLKPTNVLLDDKERASLSDFGLTQTRRLTRIRDLAYLAPETQKRHAVNDARSDIYSFGMVLWFMVTGRAPFASTPDMATLRTWVAAGERETLPEGTPQPYQSIVESCWLLPAARPRAQDLLRTLARVLRGDSAATDISLSRTGDLSAHPVSYLNLPESSHIDAPLGVIHASPPATATPPGAITPPGTDAGPSARV